MFFYLNYILFKYSKITTFVIKYLSNSGLTNISKSVTPWPIWNLIYLFLFFCYLRYSNLIYHYRNIEFVHFLILRQNGFKFLIQSFKITLVLYPIYIYFFFAVLLFKFISLYLFCVLHLNLSVCVFMCARHTHTQHIRDV